MTVCSKCGCELTFDNWDKYSWAHQRNGKTYICVECYRAYQRNWERTSPKAEQRRKKHRQYALANYIGYSGYNGGFRGYLKVNGKRPYTSNCEICGKNTKVVYHHWDDNDYSKGLWLCLRCHNVAEGVEQGIDQKYIELKRQMGGEI